MGKSKKREAKVGNFAYWQGMDGLRSSGASGTHQDRRNKRARTRSAAKARAMKEQE